MIRLSFSLVGRDQPIAAGRLCHHLSVFAIEQHIPKTNCKACDFHILWRVLGTMTASAIGPTCQGARQSLTVAECRQRRLHGQVMPEPARFLETD
jgi:hypothetical protein